MDPELKELLAKLKEEFKDKPIIGIYTAIEANELYRIHVDPQDGLVDDEYLETTLYACTNFHWPGKPYLDCGYFIDIENGEPKIICSTSPSEPIVGVDNIIKEFNKLINRAITT